MKKHANSPSNKRPPNYFSWVDMGTYPKTGINRCAGSEERRDEHLALFHVYVILRAKLIEILFLFNPGCYD
jgi:hypothetical protein